MPSLRKLLSAAAVSLALGHGKLGEAADQIPLLGYGSANVLDQGPILQAIQTGYKLVDTASLYNNQKQVGEALRLSGARREEVYLVTKFGFWPSTPLEPLLQLVRGWSPKVDAFLLASKGHEEEALHAALGELGVDYIDLCLLHSPITSVSEFLLAFIPHRLGRFGAFEGFPSWLAPPLRRLLGGLDSLLGGSAEARRGRREASWRRLEAARREGKCREIGVSNYALPLLLELETYAAELPRANELEMHPRYQPEEVLAYCHEKGIHVIGYGNGVSLGSGGGAAGGRGVAEAIAAEVGRTASQVLLRWAVQRNITVIPRSSNADRIRENAALFDFELTPEAMSRLDALDEGTPFYWHTSELLAFASGPRQRNEPEL